MKSVPVGVSHLFSAQTVLLLHEADNTTVAHSTSCTHNNTAEEKQAYTTQHHHLMKGFPQFTVNPGQLSAAGFISAARLTFSVQQVWG